MPDYDVPATWHTLETARQGWSDAPSDDDRLSVLLTVAYEAVASYAPKFTDPDTGDVSLGYADPVTGVVTAVYDTSVPANYREAQLMQARNHWNAVKVDPATGGIGDDSFVMKPFPLDWTVKQTIRPKRVLGWVG
jgi:hypothetical protein